jgi:ankyrin repeat protein
VVHSLLKAAGPTRVHALVEAASVGGWRALHHAIAAGHVRVVEELLVADADVGARLAQSADGLTPLHLAAKLGHVRIVELLMQCGADTLATTHHLGRTALHLAIDGGPHIETIRFLCAHTDLVGLYDTQGLAPLQQAISLPTLTPGRKEILATIESALRERGVSELRLLPVFLSENLGDNFIRR